MAAVESYPAPQEPVGIVAARNALGEAGYESESSALNIIHTVFHGGYKTSFDKYLDHLLPLEKVISTDMAPIIMKQHSPAIRRLLAAAMDQHDQFLEEDAAVATDFLQANPNALIYTLQGGGLLPVTEVRPMQPRNRQSRLAVLGGKKILRSTVHNTLIVDAEQIALPAMRAVVKDYKF